jgi:transcriptional regulator with XRE-family HTH domain
MYYFSTMPGVRVIGWPSQRRTYAPCRVTPHPAYMAVQNTQKKRRMELLGAQLAILRRQQGMATQEALSKLSGVAVRSISDIETGKTVPRVGTMRKLEAALKLPTGITDDFLAGTIDKLAMDPLEFPKPNTDELATMTYDEILSTAKGIEKLYGKDAAERVVVAWSVARQERLKKREADDGTHTE